MWIDLNLTNDEQQDIEQRILTGKMSALDLEAIIQQEIDNWVASDELKWMRIGSRYYRNETDILDRERKAVGESGALEPVANLANNKLANAFTRKLVNQKVGYLLSRPISVQTDDEEYQKKLEPYFNRKFMRLLQSLGTEAINKGIAWLHVYYDNEGKLRFMIIPSEQCVPIWKDAAHTELQAMIRYYQVEVYEGKEKKLITKVEWWDTNGVRRFERSGNNLIPDVEFGDYSPHVVLDDSEKPKGFNWERVPFVAFKYNDDELPLVKFIKSLVDDYDRLKSDNSNNLEDLPNSIYVVKNYGDVKGGEFRRNISQYRVVFVEGDGGVDTVGIEIDTEAYKTHQEQNRKDIFEFGRGVLFEPGKLGSNLSGEALRFMYADLDLDCNIIENQFQAALEQLEWFIDTDLANKGMGDYFDKEAEFIFNRDIMINETEAIDNIMKSVGLLPDEDLIAQHPWVTNVQDVLDRKEKEQKKQLNEFKSFRLPDDPRERGGDYAGEGN